MADFKKYHLLLFKYKIGNSTYKIILLAREKRYNFTL